MNRGYYGNDIFAGYKNKDQFLEFLKDTAKKLKIHRCQIVDEMIELYKQDGKPLPQPLSGRELINALQHVA